MSGQRSQTTALLSFINTCGHPDERTPWILNGRVLRCGIGIGALGLVLAAAGCSDGNPSGSVPTASGDSAASMPSQASVPVDTASPAQNRSVSPDVPVDATTAPAAQVKRSEVADSTALAGDPESLMAEIARLRSAPIDVVMVPVSGQPGQLQETSLTPDQQLAERGRRLYEIVELAQQVIAKTHADPQLSQVFNNAVSVLTDSRLQLVMWGDAEQGDLLVEDADALYKRDATSFAAMEAGARTVQLAQSLSQLNANNAELALAYSRRARVFAERFPQETSRAAVAVATAARQCDHLGLVDEARLGYVLLGSRFAGTPFAQQAEGPLRRFDLVGKVLEDFGGETLEGGEVTLSQYRGQVVLIAFWSSASVFPDHLPQLEAVARNAGKRFAMLGVCLDQELSGAEMVLEKCSQPWKHIFHANPELRGLANPVARYYGVTKVPSYWLVDEAGVVQSVAVNPLQLDTTISQALATTAAAH